ncbi:hypothetical protein [Treponema sp.]|nr:hypothetical protein [Treponema sp.]
MEEIYHECGIKKMGLPEWQPLYVIGSQLCSKEPEGKKKALID